MLIKRNIVCVHISCWRLQSQRTNEDHGLFTTVYFVHKGQYLLAKWMRLIKMGVWLLETETKRERKVSYSPSFSLTWLVIVLHEKGYKGVGIGHHHEFTQCNSWSPCPLLPKALISTYLETRGRNTVRVLSSPILSRKPEIQEGL